MAYKDKIDEVASVARAIFRIFAIVHGARRAWKKKSFS